MVQCFDQKKSGEGSQNMRDDSLKPLKSVKFGSVIRGALLLPLRTLVKTDICRQRIPDKFT